MNYTLEGAADNLYAESVTIASGASESEAIPTQGKSLVGIVMPAAWTSAANLTPRVGLTRGSLLPVYDAGGNLQKTAADASRYIAIPLSDAVWGPYLAVRSVDSDGVAVNQAAARTIILLFRRYLS